MTTAVTLEEIGAVILILLLLASASIPFLVIGHFADKRDERKKKQPRHRPMSSYSPEERKVPFTPTLPPANYQPTPNERDPRALELKEMLLTLYEPKYPFLVSVDDLKPKRRMGFYNTHHCRLTIHYGWRTPKVSYTDPRAIAIHEFAHHITFLEIGKYNHTREFKTVNSILADCYNSKYPPITPDPRFYLPPEKRIKSITLNTK